MSSDYREYRDYGVSDGCRSVLLYWVVLPSWLVLGALIVVFALLRTYDVSVPPSYRYVPFLASVVVFGLPHGALDHLVPAQIHSVNSHGVILEDDSDCRDCWQSQLDCTVLVRSDRRICS